MKREGREREKNNNSLLAASLIAGYLCNPASSVWNFSTLPTEDDLWFADSCFHRWAPTPPPPPPPSTLAQAHTSGGPLRHICRCTVPVWVEPFCSGVLTHLNVSVPRLLSSLCEAQTRSPMNQSHARMSRNPERIRERSHPVSSFDWIVSLAGARARRGPLAPAQTASLHLHRGDFYIYIYINFGQFGACSALFSSFGFLYSHSSRNTCNRIKC